MSGRNEEQFAAQRAQMVLRQLCPRGIRDQRVLDAMGSIPRERFVPAEYRGEAYEDHPVPIGLGQTISQPYVVALMTQELALESGHRVLDVGAGSGYQTAILAALAAKVVAVERIDDLARRASATLSQLGVANATVVTGDGTLGWPARAPYDRILCGAGGPNVPAAWIEQLADGGRIVMPVGGTDIQTLIAVDKAGDRIRRREICGVRFVRLIGEQGWPRPQG